MNTQSLLEIAIAAAKKAGAYQKSRWNTQLDIQFKDEINLVTEVDKHSEALIVAHLKEHFPDHDIMAEEGSGERKDSAFKWIIDPLDGTTNFAHGYPCFCVSIGLEHKGTIILGVVYDPIREELFSATKGNGAFLNNQKIKVSSIKKINEALLATGFAYNIRKTEQNNLAHFENMLMKAQGIRRDGSAALDLCYVACGRFDGYWELNLFPWDVAAGTLILEESGGKTTQFKGSAYSIYDREICASNQLIHEDMIQILKPKLVR